MLLNVSSLLAIRFHTGYLTILTCSCFLLKDDNNKSVFMLKDDLKKKQFM